jgi:bacterioferritin
MDSQFSQDIKKIRERDRKHIERGAITAGYQGDPITVVRLLNEALATEIVCVLRYKRHYFMAEGVNAHPVAQEFLQHANEEQQHADVIAARIIQLNGEPNFSPEGLMMRSHSEYVEGDSLLEMIKEDLVAERIAIESYTEVILYLGEKDMTTRRLLEGVLAKEEEHAEELATLLQTLQPAQAAQSRKSNLERNRWNASDVRDGSCKNRSLPWKGAPPCSDASIAGSISIRSLWLTETTQRSPKSAAASELIKDSRNGKTQL